MKGTKLFKSVVALCMAGTMVGCSTSQTSEPTETEDTKITTEVETAFGTVKGTEENGVLKYFAVPYGAAPTGDLRWSAPQDPEKWEDVLDCSERGEMAMQMGTVTDEDGNSTAAVVGTVDTLNLDVYTTSEASNLPVVVYVHGGNNQTGQSWEIVGDDMVVEDGVVYVSVNYRLGLLGFNCLPALQDGETSTNFGLLDIAKSLSWVKENIANFGGDPNNITITGFSAGGRDVMAMLISPVFKGLFDKAIVYSGGMTIANLEDSEYKVAQIMSPLAIEDGKAADEESAIKYLLQDTDEVRDYLYSISEERLTGLMSNASIRMAKFPHLYGDDIALPSEGFEGGSYVNDVPVIMLTGTSEFTFFGAFDANLATVSEDKLDAATAFALGYGNDFYRVFNAQLSAEKMEGSYTSDIYVCEIAYGGATSESEIPMFGAFHGIFVPMLATSNNYSGIYDFSNDGYQAMADLYHAYIQNFLATGNPNGDNTAGEWKTWNTETKQTMVFDANAETGEASAELQNTYTTNADIIAAMDADDTLDAETKLFVIQNVLNGRWFSDDLDTYYNTPTLWK